MLLVYVHVPSELIISKTPELLAVFTCDLTCISSIKLPKIIFTGTSLEQENACDEHKVWYTATNTCTNILSRGSTAETYLFYYLQKTNSLVCWSHLYHSPLPLCWSMEASRWENLKYLSIHWNLFSETTPFILLSCHSTQTWKIWGKYFISVEWKTTYLEIPCFCPSKGGHTKQIPAYNTWQFVAFTPLKIFTVGVLLLDMASICLSVSLSMSVHPSVNCHHYCQSIAPQC